MKGQKELVQNSGEGWNGRMVLDGEVQWLGGMMVDGMRLEEVSWCSKLQDREHP